MDKIILEEFPNRWHDCAEVWKNGSKIHTIKSYYYEVDEQWIYEYERAGGSDSAHKGTLLKKIFIGDCEFERRTHYGAF